MFVTAGTQEHDELLGELLDAVQSLGLDAQADHGALVVDGSRHALRRSGGPTPPRPTSQLWCAAGAGRGPAVVVADRISDAGRDVLRADGWGWLDRRGHLRLWAPGVRIESPLASRTGDRVTTGNVWTTVGLEIALHALVHPDEPVTARRVGAGARPQRRRDPRDDQPVRRQRTDRAPGPTGRCCPSCSGRPRPTGPTGTGWPAGRRSSDVAARVGAEELVRVDERAATLGGARIAAAGDLPARCYVRSPRRAAQARGLADRDSPDPLLGPRRAGELAAPERRTPPDDRPPLGGRPPAGVRAATGGRPGPGT